MAYIIKDKGAFQKTNGKALQNSGEVLNPECNCGIECCDGIIKLPVSYSSTHGDLGPAYAYILDGEFVIGDEATVRAAIAALKALIPPSPTPTPTPTVTPTISVTPTITPTITTTPTVTPSSSGS
jgi:hypothetical protein